MRHALIFAFCLLFPVIAMAADNAEPGPAKKTSAPTLLLKRYEPSHPEKFLLAFNKLANTQPDFLQWAQQSPFLEKAKDADRDVIINRESNRLSQALASFNVDEPLVVHAKIHLDDYSTLQEVLHLSEFTPKTYFSYSLYGQDVAVVPKDIASFGDIKISKTDMDEMLSKSEGGDVMAELLLKPVVADAREPFVIGNHAYWLLLTEIGEIRFWTATGEPKLLWMHRADWFKPKEDKVLMDLKSGEGGL